MAWDTAHRPLGGRRRSAAAAAATVLLLTAAVVLGLHRAGAPARAGGPPPAPSRSASAASGPAAPGTGGGVVTLPAPAAPDAAVPLGYPHTALGAASAAWRWTRTLYGLDPARAAAAAAACADPTFPTAAARAAQTTLAARAGLGLPAAGPASPAYLVLTPRMVQVADRDPDRPVVDVLATADLGSAAGVRLHRVQVLELHLHWAPTAGGGDYRLLDRDGDPTRVAGLAADPDTPAAYRLGWRDVVLAGGAR